MKEIKFHGRGGQGVVLGAEMLAYAFILENKYASSIPMFGFERRGAPVTASIRFDERPLRDTHLVYEPDCSVILDASFVKSPAPFEGLKGDGIVLLNSNKALQNSLSMHSHIKCLGTLDATGIALEEIGRPINNTCMLGALAKITGWVSLDSIISSLEMSFSGDARKRNERAVQRGYESLKLTPIEGGSSAGDPASASGRH